MMGAPLRAKFFRTTSYFFSMEATSFFGGTFGVFLWAVRELMSFFKTKPKFENKRKKKKHRKTSRGSFDDGLAGGSSDHGGIFFSSFFFLLPFLYFALFLSHPSLQEQNRRTRCLKRHQPIQTHSIPPFFLLKVLERIPRSCPWLNPRSAPSSLSHPPPSLLTSLPALKNPVVKKHYKKMIKQTLLLMMSLISFVFVFVFCFCFCFCFCFSHPSFRITYSLAFIFYSLPLRFVYFVSGWDVNEGGLLSLSLSFFSLSFSLLSLKPIFKEILNYLY